MWKYQNEAGAVMIIRDENHRSLAEREGFELVGEVELDKKGKLIAKAEDPEE